MLKKILFPICKQSLEGCFSQSPHGKGERMDQDIFSHPAGWLFAVSCYLSAKGGLATTGENQYLIPGSGVETCPCPHCPWFCGWALAETCSDFRTHGQLAPEDVVSSQMYRATGKMKILETVKIYKKGSQFKRNYNPGNEPSKGIWTSGGVGIRHEKWKKKYS